MCEADLYQLTNAEFTKQAEGMYGSIAVIFNACGTAAHSQFYPCHARVVALSPYHKGGRHADTQTVAGIAKEAWSRDKGVVFHCNETFHRGILACIATFTVAFNCVPQDRMFII